LVSGYTGVLTGGWQWWWWLSWNHQLVFVIVMLGGGGGGRGHSWLITQTSATGALDSGYHSNTLSPRRVSFVFWPASVMAAIASSVVVLDRGNNTTCTINLHGNDDIVDMILYYLNRSLKCCNCPCAGRYLLYGWSRILSLALILIKLI